MMICSRYVKKNIEHTGKYPEKGVANPFRGHTSKQTAAYLAYYSYLSTSTGFLFAAIHVCQLTVRSTRINAIAPPVK